MAPRADWWKRLTHPLVLSGLAVAAVLAGEAEATGCLPVATADSRTPVSTRS